MQYIQGIEQYQDNIGTAVTLGKFDGLHIGHRKLVEQVKRFAEDNQLKSVVFTFDMRPFEQKLGKAPGKLMTAVERRNILETEVDYLIECPFTEELQMMDAASFIEEIIVNRLHARYVVVGEDFHYGFQRLGDPKLLKQYEAAGAFKVQVVPQEQYGGREVSSTYIKEVLPSGNMELLEQLLGYPYTIIGEVIHGNQIGRTLGMPTMNLEAGPNKLLPPFGVYVCQVKVDGLWFNGICNIGVKPTISTFNGVTIESHLFDYDKDTYGREIEVRLLRRERNEMKFSGVDELREQMRKDIAKGKEYFI